MTINKNDFIEIEFTGKTSEGKIFDSNIKEDLKKEGIKLEAKPFIFSIGQNMFLSGVENFLIGKNLGEYKISLKAKDAFGIRDRSLIKTVPLNIFSEKQVNPVPGLSFNFDGRPGKILTVSGGRVIIDFNHPMAGKEVEYFVKVLRKVEDKNEQIDSFNDFLFRQKFPFEIKEEKLILKADKKLSGFLSLFKDKYKDLFNFDLEVEELKKQK